MLGSEKSRKSKAPKRGFLFCEQVFFTKEEDMKKNDPLVSVGADPRGPAVESKLAKIEKEFGIPSAAVEKVPDEKQGTPLRHVTGGFRQSRLKNF